MNILLFQTGHIFVHKGLLEMMNSEDELAAVLGHEMSHALLQHSVRKTLAFVSLHHAGISNHVNPFWSEKLDLQSVE